MAEPAPIRSLDKVQGTSLLAIRSTLPVFQRHDPNLRASVLEVAEQAGTTVVLLGVANDPGRKYRPLGVWVESKKEMTREEVDSVPAGVDRINGSSVAPFLKAADVFEKKNLDLADYKAELLEEGDSLVVVFEDKNQRRPVLGSVGKPGFEVEMKARDLSVTRSNFLR